MSRYGWLKQSGILIFDLKCQLLFSNHEGRLLHSSTRHGDAPVMEQDLAFDVKRLCLRLKKMIGAPGESQPDKLRPETLTVTAGEVNYKLEGSILASESSKEPCILITVEEEDQRPAPKLNLSHFQSTYKLTRREIQILELLSKGASYKEIAYSLSISAHTVRDHIKNIRLKLHAESKCGIMARLIEDAGMFEEARVAAVAEDDDIPAAVGADARHAADAKPAGGGQGESHLRGTASNGSGASVGRAPENRASRGAFTRSGRL